MILLLREDEYFSKYHTNQKLQSSQNALPMIINPKCQPHFAALSQKAAPAFLIKLKRHSARRDSAEARVHKLKHTFWSTVYHPNMLTNEINSLTKYTTTMKRAEKLWKSIQWMENALEIALQSFHAVVHSWVYIKYYLHRHLHQCLQSLLMSAVWITEGIHVQGRCETLKNVWVGKGNAVNDTTELFV